MAFFGFENRITRSRLLYFHAEMLHIKSLKSAASRIQVRV